VIDLPEVLSISIHDCLAYSSSILIVVLICAISALTKTESRSPSAWYLTKMSKASSCRSLLIRYRGLSGRKLAKLETAFWRARRIVDLQNSDDLDHGWEALQKRWYTPRPVVFELRSSHCNNGCYDWSYEVGWIEEWSHGSSFLWVRKLSDHCRPRNNAKDNAESEYHSCKNIHGT